MCDHVWLHTHTHTLYMLVEEKCGLLGKTLFPALLLILIMGAYKQGSMGYQSTVLLSEAKKSKCRAGTQESKIRLESEYILKQSL